jgi:hypothetical protein
MWRTGWGKDVQSGTSPITLLFGKLVELVETTFTGLLVVFTHSYKVMV